MPATERSPGPGVGCWLRLNNCNSTNATIARARCLAHLLLLCLTYFGLNVANAEAATAAAAAGLHEVARATPAASPPPPLAEQQADDVIQAACNGGLDFKSIAEFRHFINKFKALDEEQLRALEVPSRCLKQRQAILELSELVVTENVCDVAQIDALISYHNKHFKTGRRHSGWPMKLTQKAHLTRRFFSKYAVQVAHTCKSNLIGNLETSRDLLREQAKSLEEAKEKVLKERPGLKSNIKLIEEQPDAPATANVKPKSEPELTLGEYREALTRLKRPEDILTFEREECAHFRNRRVEIAADKVQMFFKPALVCLKLAQYYSSSVLSIARLANYGYLAADGELDVKLADSQLVRDWIVAVQVCEPMLYMRTDKIERDLATVDTCSERVVALENMVFEDTISELADQEKLDEWLEKSEATRSRAQKIMKSAMRKLAKVSLMRELRKPDGLQMRNLFTSGGIKGAIKGAVSAAAGAAASSASSGFQADMIAHSRQVSHQLVGGGGGGGGRMIDVSALQDKPSDAQSFEVLIKLMAEEGADDKLASRPQRDAADESADESEGAVSAFDPLTTLASSITIIAIMLTFEWLFFVVMTLAARICHKLNFQFDNLLTFPPKVLSWSDADFAHYNENLEKIDEDDFFDYDELNPEEQKQRDLLAKVFGRPPPMMFRE